MSGEPDAAVRALRKAAEKQVQRQRQADREAAQNPQASTSSRAASAPLTVAMDTAVAAGSAGIMEKQKHRAAEKKLHTVRERMGTVPPPLSQDPAWSRYDPASDTGFNWVSEKAFSTPHATRSATHRAMKRSTPADRKNAVQAASAGVRARGGSGRADLPQQRGKRRAQKRAQRAAVRKPAGSRHTAQAGQKKASHTSKTTVAFRHAAAGHAALPVVALFLLVILLAGGSLFLLLGTSFGLLFVNSGDGGIMDLVAEIDAEFQQEIRDIQAANPHENIIISGRQADWREVLAVFSVQLTDGEAGFPSELGSAEVQNLRRIFRQMNTIDFWLTGGSTAPSTPGIAALSHTETTAPTEPEPITLHIVIRCRTAADLAAELGFTLEQTESLHELLAPENADMWDSLLAGVPLRGLPNSAGWVYPLSEEAEVASPFGMRTHPTTGQYRLHAGVDFTADTGDPIYAVREGTVITAAYNTSAGNHVVLDHGDGYQSIYMHMVFFIVSEGETVEAGQTIGYVGSTGDSTGPHLHLGMTIDGDYFDPLRLISYTPPETIPSESSQPEETTGG